jgi:cyclically-permuted mutarotase family protein
MKSKKVIFLFFICPMLIAHHTIAQHTDDLHISWSQAALLPDLSGVKQIGVAGPFAGLSNGVMLIAGGSNFPGAKPWNGGKKVNRREIYLLSKLHGAAFKCIALNQYLAEGMAYGASVTTSKGIVCLGGETDGANCSTKAFLMRWDAHRRIVVFDDLPPIPIAIANASATAINGTVYLFGGEKKGIPVDKAFLLDLNNNHPKWKSIPPLPIAMSHSVAVPQSNKHYSCIYVIGGRSATASGISHLHGTTFCFDPVQQKWSRLSDISDGKKATNLSAATAIAIGDDRIILISGDKGDIFHKIESYNAAINKAATESEKKELQTKKMELITHHPGFSQDVYLYNTVTDQWRKLHKLPFHGQVTTTAVKWGNNILIPGGEIMPGTRTAAITLGLISKS